MLVDEAGRKVRLQGHASSGKARQAQGLASFRRMFCRGNHAREATKTATFYIS
jgi:hypothetical protein